MFLINTARESLQLWMAMAPYLLMGMFIAGILHVFIGENFISRHLGGRTYGGIVKATLLGIPLPICSCGVIPVAASLKKEGAGSSATLSFLVSTPTTGVDSIAATYSLMGPLFAVFRPLAAFVSGITIGTLHYFLEGERPARRVKTHVHHRTPVHFRLKEVFRYGFLELAEDIGKWLVLGVILGGLLTVAIPEQWVTSTFSSPALQFLAMLVISIPLYVCATGSIPIAASLILKGFTPGAALVFLIAGPATNTVTLSFVLSKLGKKAFAVYLASIGAVSLLAGWSFNLIWRAMGADTTLISPHGGHLPFWLRVGAGAFLLILVAIPLIYRKPEGGSELKYRISVPDISCKHCKMVLENQIGQLDKVNRVMVDVDRKMLYADGDISLNDLKKSIRDTGYTPE